MVVTITDVASLFTIRPPRDATAHSVTKLRIAHMAAPSCMQLLSHARLNFARDLRIKIRSDGLYVFSPFRMHALHDFGMQKGIKPSNNVG